MDQNTSMTDAANTILRISGGVENPGAMQGPTQVVPGSIRNIQLLHPAGAATSSNRLPGVMVLLAQIPPASAQTPVSKTLPPLSQVPGPGRGNPKSGAGRGEPKGSGKHQRDRVQKGTFPPLHKGVAEWAETRKEEQAKFEQFFAEKGVHEPIPWKRETMNDSGNKLKVLYMYLIRSAHDGILELVRGPTSEGLFGITKIKVLDRELFDAGPFPSLSSSGIYGEPKNKDLKYKQMFKLWQTAGFAEKIQTERESGYLELEFKDELKQKVKDQVNETRQRQKERSGTMQADV